MEAKHYDRLLRELAHTAEAATQGYDLEAAYARLDDYVASVLAGEAAQEHYPDVAFFLATDADFATIYRALHRHMQSYDPAAEEEVAGAVDFARLAAYADGQLSLSPHDLARPFVTPRARADEEQRYLHQLIPYWQQHLPQRGGLFMSGGDATLEAVAIPERDEPAWLDLVLDEEDDGAVVDGQVRPLQPDLLAAPVRLYHISTQPEPHISPIAEAHVDRFGHFAFHGVAAGRYVLALVIEDEIVGTTWLDIPGA